MAWDAIKGHVTGRYRVTAESGPATGPPPSGVLVALAGRPCGTL